MPQIACKRAKNATEKRHQGGFLALFARLRVLLALLLVATCLLAQDRGVAIRLREQNGSTVFEAAAAPDAALVVYVDGESLGSLPPLLGSQTVEAGVLRFAPRFPLRPGLRYRAVLTVAGKRLEKTFAIPKAQAAGVSEVEHVYPTSDQLPENQLKFYLHFSAPMSRGEAYRHIHLLDTAGKEVADPFLELDEELWDAAAKRLTLFFDPGRIKRGLKPREEVGPSLEEGKAYTLAIDRDWPDANGNSLHASYRKAFRVGPPDERPLDLKEWKVQVPAAGTREPLTVRFPRPLDHALLERVVWVVDGQGARIAGSRSVTDEERCWQFTPAAPWRMGAYRLVAETTLEDLAGNSIGRPFEVDVFRRVERRVEAKTASLPFQVGDKER
jgi:hypothetical protein